MPIKTWASDPEAITKLLHIFHDWISDIIRSKALDEKFGELAVSWEVSGLAKTLHGCGLSLKAVAAIKPLPISDADLKAVVPDLIEAISGTDGLPVHVSRGTLLHPVPTVMYHLRKAENQLKELREVMMLFRFATSGGTKSVTEQEVEPPSNGKTDSAKPKPLEGPPSFGKVVDVANVANMVARYFVDSNEAVLDWAALLEKFEDTFDLMGGSNLFRPLDSDDEVGDPYRYRKNQIAGNLAGLSLANSIREFVRAVLRVGKYSNTGRSDRIDTNLLTRWAEAVEVADAIELESPELVGLFFNVSEAQRHFTEEVACDVAVAAIRNRPTNVPLQETEQPTPTELAGDAIEVATPREGADESTSGGNKKPPLNAFMRHLLDKYGTVECAGWSVRTWVLNLTPHWGRKASTSSISGQPVYVELQAMNAAVKQRKAEIGTVKDKSGKRRSTRF